MRLLRSFLLLCCVSVLVPAFPGCRKPVADVAPEYVGYWIAKGPRNVSDFRYIVIDENSNGTYFNTATAEVGGRDNMLEKKVKFGYPVLKFGMTKLEIVETPQPFDTATYTTWNDEVKILFPPNGKPVMHMLVHLSGRDRDTTVRFYKKP